MEIANRIEHYLLCPDSVEAEVRRLCMRAKDYHLAALVVPPSWARFAVTGVADSDVAIDIPVGYPDGTHTASVKSLEARLALEEGVGEVIVVPNLAAYKSGWRKIFGEDIAYVLKQCRLVNPDATCRVLVYVDLLSPADLREVIQMALASGGRSLLLANYSHSLLDPPTVQQVMSWTEAAVRVSVMGEIRTLEEALPILSLGAERLVTPAGFELVQEARAR